MSRTTKSSSSNRKAETWVDALLKSGRRAVMPVLVMSALVNFLILASPLYMLQVYDRVLMSAEMGTLLFVSLMALVAFIGLGIFDSLRSRALAHYGAWTFRRFSPLVLSASMTNALQGGDRSTRYLRDLQQVQSFAGGNGIVPFLDAPFAPFFVLITFMLHPYIGYLTVFGGILLFVIAFVSDRMARRAAQDARLSDIDATIAADGFIRGADYIETGGMRAHAIARYQAASQDGTDRQLKTQNITGTAAGMSKAIRLMLQSASLGLGAVLVIDPNIAFTPGAMIAGSILMARSLAPVEQSVNAWRSLHAARQSLRTLRTLSEDCPEPAARVELPSAEGVLTAENLAYWPLESKKPLFASVTFAAQPAQVFGIVGASGTGKTTLCRQIMGVEQISQGALRLDGADIAQWDREQFARSVGYLPQNPVFFDGTIAQNIAGFSETAEQADILAAANLAGAHDLILQLPDGYATQIGPSGVSLSGGQGQQIGLARAYFDRPKVLVLDEPTTHLDESGRRAFGVFLKSAVEARQTVIIATHDRGVVSACDTVLVLNNNTAEIKTNDRGAGARNGA